MDTSRLQLDRFLRKDPNQFDQTKDAAYAAANPAPKRGDDALRKIGRPKGSEEDDGAPNILTGTVIVSCFIQTSALPSRIELEGNDLTFFDDTYEQGGKVIGDTSRLIFTHASGKSGDVIEQGFIMEKRASVFNTYDNVLSWYGLPPKPGAHNYIFIGRNAYNDDQSRYVTTMVLAVDADVLGAPISNDSQNGIFKVEYSENNTYIGDLILGGRTESLFAGAGLDGRSIFIIAGDGGVGGVGYQLNGVVQFPIQVYELGGQVVVAIAGLEITAQSGTYLGYYTDSTSLTTAHPTASAGDWAFVAATGTVWLWTTSWANTGAPFESATINQPIVNVIQFVPGEVEELGEGQMAYHDDGVTQQFRMNAGGFFGSVDLTGV